MFYVVTEYLLVEVTVTIPLVPPSLSVVVLLIMPLLTFPLSVEVKNMASTKHSPETGGGRNVYLGLYYIFFGGGGKILPRMIGQVLLEEPQILLIVSVHVFLKFIKMKLLVILPLLVVG